MARFKSKSSSHKMTLVGMLAFMLITLIAAILWVLLMSEREIPPGNIQPMNIILGGVMGWTGSVIHFIVGSSKGSKDKTDAMAAEMMQDET